MAAESVPERSVMRSVERALDVIDTLGESGRPLRLADVARATGLHIATAQRILRVLEHREYVSLNSGVYSNGPAVLAAAHSYQVGNQLVLAAMPVLQELATVLGATASLSVRIGKSRVLVARVEGSSPLRYQLPIGGRLPLHLGAGKVFLAYMSSEERTKALEGISEIVTAAGEHIPMAEFGSILKKVAKQGYAVSSNERVMGATSVSAPVRVADGSVVAALQVSGSHEDLQGERLDAMPRELVNAAASIAQRCR
ncbi:MAG TPA: IclR family transcriptional regulator [Flexivirga sp.]|uniref:IclR family transcriptional regulator n=1 Tax=Flexivirga sp. TaxID=1962927 RepID=UPI002B97A4D8|nr:IclR family transcriptional regulator [Flexivirga sp.]HWC22312.1 IclR family transcriptional regulator [Flexivirga sp.]